MPLCCVCFEPSSFSFWVLAASPRFEALEELRFQLKLSLRRSEVVEAGVLGSSDVDVRVEGVSFLSRIGAFVSGIDERTISAFTR
jgi:hypothetical protein